MASIVLTDASLEQNDADNVASAPLTVVSNVVRTFGVSGVLTTDGCTSPLRNGRAVALGSLAFSSQTGSSVTGTLTLTFPLTAGLQTSGPIQATVDTTGHVNGTLVVHDQAGLDNAVQRSGHYHGHHQWRRRSRSTSPVNPRRVRRATSRDGWRLPRPRLDSWASSTTRLSDLWSRWTGRWWPPRRSPSSIARYRVLFEVAGDTAPFPAPSAVLFTGPPGSQLAETGGAELAQLATNAVEYRSTVGHVAANCPRGRLD